MALPQQPLGSRQAARGLWASVATADLERRFALENLVRPDWPAGLPVRSCGNPLQPRRTQRPLQPRCSAWSVPRL